MTGTHEKWVVLEGLRDEEIESVLALGRRRRFARREIVWHEGDRADPIHLIRSGRIAVQVMTALGESATVAVWGPGDAAGLVDGLATELFHETSAVALQETETVALRLDDFFDVRRRMPAVNDAVLKILADKVLEMTKQVIDALYVPAEIRVLRRISALADLYDHGEGAIVIPLTQVDVGEIAGVTRPTVNRVLRKEEQRGSLQLARGSIRVIDKERLASRLR
jgi:CRP-like cAMP-binding protein